MKKAVLLLVVVITHAGANGQGLVNFFNSAATLISNYTPNGSTVLSGPVGSWYFGLLTAPVGTVDPTAFTFSGAYGTNQTAAGRFTGGTVAIAGWAPGTTRSFMVAGWDAGLGHDFRSAWLANPPYPEGFGLSLIGSGSPGGYNSSTGGTDPNLNIFGGFPTLIPVGFVIGVPEPSSSALAILGLAAVLSLRHRRRTSQG